MKLLCSWMAIFVKRGDSGDSRDFITLVDGSSYEEGGGTKTEVVASYMAYVSEKAETGESNWSALFSGVQSQRLDFSEQALDVIKKTVGTPVDMVIGPFNTTVLKDAELLARMKELLGNMRKVGGFAYNCAPGLGH